MDADTQRKAAGERAAEFVEDGMVIGYGTGRGAAAALEALARRKVRVRGAPTSRKTIELCRRFGLPLVSLEEHPILDLVIDGADEVDPQRQMIRAEALPLSARSWWHWPRAVGSSWSRRRSSSHAWALREECRSSWSRSAGPPPWLASPRCFPELCGATVRRATTAE